MKIADFTWLVPFLCFIAGYIVMQQFFPIAVVIVPSVVGKQVHEVLPLLSSLCLNVRILDQKEEAEMPEGVILSQIPSPGKHIKAFQPLFIVTTKKPATLKAPSCVGLPVAQLLDSVKSLGITVRMYSLAHQYPVGLCFAQCPSAGEALEKNRLIVYISAGDSKPVVWPSFVGYSLEAAEYFLDNYGIKPLVVGMAVHKDQSVIVDQRPFAGTLLTLDEKKPLSVQLRVQ